jgi:hypothetical protein
MRPSRRLVLGLYPFAAGAMALNVYFASLLLGWAGWSILSPMHSVWAGLVLGWPAAWAYARHLARLMREADGEPAP